MSHFHHRQVRLRDPAATVTNPKRRENDSASLADFLFFLLLSLKRKEKKLEIEVTLPPSLLQIHDREK